VISDRSLDAFDNPAKTTYRERNLEFLRRALYLLWDDIDAPARLRCTWCELLGAIGYLSYQLLLREGVITPEQFLGVDTSERIVRKHLDLGIRAETGNLHEILPVHPDVGVLNLDGYYAVGSPKLKADLLGIRAAAERSLTLFGEFCLLLNSDLDAAPRTRGPGTVGLALRAHARMIAQTFDKVPTHSYLDDELILPVGAEDRVAAGELGSFGCIEVYRGRESGHRMANLRLALG
jgi:hypothetical protein